VGPGRGDPARARLFPVGIDEHPPVRRVVTGFGPDGRSTTARDDVVQPVTPYRDFPGAAMAPVWFTDLPDDVRSTADAALDGAGRRPGRGGTRFYFVRIDPGAEIPFHTTPTVEYHYVLEGEVTCVLEDGEATVRAGDVLVQRATPHGWVNRGDVPFVSVAVMVDVGLDEA